MRNRIQELIRKFKNKCDYIEVRIEYSESENIGIRNNNIEAVKKVEESGGCVRVAFRGSWAFSSYNNLDNLDRITANTVERAACFGEGRTTLAHVESVTDSVVLELIVDPRTYNLQEKVRLCQDYSDIMMAFSSEITTSLVSYEQKFKKLWFGNSDGTSIDSENVDMNFGVYAIASNSSKTQSAHYSIGSSNDFSIFLNRGEEVINTCKNAQLQLKAPKIKGGIYPVVVDPKLGGIFIHEAFGHMSEADKIMNNPKFKEILNIGRKVASPILNVYDTGKAIGTRGYYKYDDEGVPSGENYLIKDGFINGHLHNRESAAKLGEKPTGNARALSYKYAPIIRMSNTCIEGGQQSFEEMINDIKLGVYAVEGVGGSGGEIFTFTAGRGYMIRNGKIEEMVTDVKLIGNLFITLKNIDMIGSDFTVIDASGGCGKNGQFPLPVTESSPHFRIQNATIGGEK
jgi:TldD protein